jgi:hypothetical protein
MISDWYSAMILKGFFNLIMENNTALSMFNSTVKYSGEQIFVKPFCDFFGISYENQCRFIKKDMILQTSSTKKSDKLLFGDERERVTLSKIGFMRWIQLINPQIVQVSLREKLKEYQYMIFEFLLGNIQSEDKTKLAYTRLNRLRNLKEKINHEIKKSEKELQGYLCTKFGQIRLNLKTS